MANETDYTKLSPEDLIKLIKQKDADLATAENFIGELKEDLILKEEEILNAGAVPTVKVGKDTYDIVIPAFKFFDNDTKEIVDYSAQHVQKDDKLAAALVKMGSGVLVKKEPVQKEK